MIANPNEILDFWFKETPAERHFASDPAFDAAIRARFEESWRAARMSAFAEWQSNPNGALALIILLDQFPRNMFRGQSEAFATDHLAREAAKHGVSSGFDLAFPPEKRSFFYLPFMHSENPADQETCLRLTAERLGEGHFSYPYAQNHCAVIRRFGRFPARNKALGRVNTPEEAEFLASHPAGF